MAHQTGANAPMVIGWETAFATPPASGGLIMPKNSCGVTASRPRHQVATLQNGRNPKAGFLGRKDVSGPLVVPVDSIAMLYWLKAMFGAATVSGTDPYVHEYKIGDSMPSFTLENQFPDLDTAVYEQFYGCKIASAGFSFGEDGELVANLQVVGADYSPESSPFDASAAEVDFERIYNSQAAFTEGGSAYALARKVSLDIDFGLDLDQYCIGGGGVRRSIPEGLVQISGEIETVFENAALLTKAENDTESSLAITCTGSAASIFELELQEVKYARKSPPVDRPAGLIVTHTFEAYLNDGAEASAVVGRITNSVSAAV